jgi:hypothetical protein
MCGPAGASPFVDNDAAPPSFLVSLRVERLGCPSQPLGLLGVRQRYDDGEATRPPTVQDVTASAAPGAGAAKQGRGSSSAKQQQPAALPAALTGVVATAPPVHLCGAEGGVADAVVVRMPAGGLVAGCQLVAIQQDGAAGAEGPVTVFASLLDHVNRFAGDPVAVAVAPPSASPVAPALQFPQGQAVVLHAAVAGLQTTARRVSLLLRPSLDPAAWNEMRAALQPNRRSSRAALRMLLSRPAPLSADEGQACRQRVAADAQRCFDVRRVVVAAQTSGGAGATRKRPRAGLLTFGDGPICLLPSAVVESPSALAALHAAGPPDLEFCGIPGDKDES